jgi:adenylate cyclase
VDKTLAVAFSGGSNDILSYSLADLRVCLDNAYLTSMSEAIEEAGGFIDKYVGDAIVAIFGAPVCSDNHAIEAAAAAFDCQRRLDVFNRAHAPPIQHRIGLNTGEALIGNIGSRGRFNYTAFGDNLNLASRLEQLNTSFGTSILASESIVRATGETFVWREIDTIRVRERSAQVTVFQPLGRRGEESQAQRERARTYSEGLQAWRARDFFRAETVFSRFPDDLPALFRKRCRTLVDNRPMSLGSRSFFQRRSEFLRSDVVASPHEVSARLKQSGAVSQTRQRTSE